MCFRTSLYYFAWNRLERGLAKHDNKSTTGIGDREEGKKCDRARGTHSPFFLRSGCTILPFEILRVSRERGTMLLEGGNDQLVVFRAGESLHFLSGDRCSPRSVRFPIAHDAWRPPAHWNADRQVLNRDKV